MTKSQLERSEKIRDDHFTLMQNVMLLHQKITRIHGYLWSGLELEHDVNKCDMEQAKMVAKQIDEQFPDGIEYAIKRHQSEIEELNDEILAYTFDTADNGVKNSDFVECQQ